MKEIPRPLDQGDIVENKPIETQIQDEVVPDDVNEDIKEKLNAILEYINSSSAEQKITVDSLISEVQSHINKNFGDQPEEYRQKLNESIIENLNQYIQFPSLILAVHKDMSEVAGHASHIVKTPGNFLRFVQDYGDKDIVTILTEFEKNYVGGIAVQCSRMQEFVAWHSTEEIKSTIPRYKEMILNYLHAPHIAESIGRKIGYLSSNPQIIDILSRPEIIQELNDLEHQHFPYQTDLQNLIIEDYNNYPVKSYEYLCKKISELEYEINNIDSEEKAFSASERCMQLRDMADHWERYREQTNSISSVVKYSTSIIADMTNETIKLLKEKTFILANMIINNSKKSAIYLNISETSNNIYRNDEYVKFYRESGRIHPASKIRDILDRYGIVLKP